MLLSSIGQMAVFLSLTNDSVDRKLGLQHFSQVLVCFFFFFFFILVLLMSQILFKSVSILPHGLVCLWLGDQ